MKPYLDRLRAATAAILFGACCALLLHVATGGVIL
jgi:hypothetical protein